MNSFLPERTVWLSRRRIAVSVASVS